jgi:hypothetical protein
MEPPLTVGLLIAQVGRIGLESSSAGFLAASIPGLLFVLAYFYLWPSTVDYYRQLRRNGDPRLSAGVGDPG